MVNSITAVLAVLAAGATASTLSAGQAQVKNKCNYDVYLCNVPAEGGGQTQQDKTLSPGDSWSQTWTELTNGQGWSIKLSNSTSLESILQYEYTFHNDGTIWFDLSCVNGDPWPENWVMTGDNGCDPKQTAYRYPTDDDYGMQACSQDASVLVTLCETEDSESSSSASAPAYTSASSSSSSSVYSAPAYSTTSTSAEAPAYTSTSSTASAPHYSHTGGWGWFSNSDGAVEAAEDYTAPAAVTPTTLATSVVVSQADNGADVTVVEVVTAVETAIVTAFARDVTPGRHRRHEHHPAHQHHV